tara:strand:- start:504 stop:734 length:231 start_codon:yes stop_codon:yes gene_type:complete
MTNDKNTDLSSSNMETYSLSNEDYNEYLVQTKLDPKLYKKYYKYLRQNNLNRSSGIKHILKIFFSKPLQQFLQKQK